MWNFFYSERFMDSVSSDPDSRLKKVMNLGLLYLQSLIMHPKPACLRFPLDALSKFFFLLIIGCTIKIELQQTYLHSEESTTKTIFPQRSGDRSDPISHKHGEWKTFEFISNKQSTSHPLLLWMIQSPL